MSGQSRELPQFARFVGAVTALVGVVVLAAWLVDVPAITSILPSWPKMAALTALGFLSAGSAVVLYSTAPAAGRLHAVAKMCSLLTILVGVVGAGARVTTIAPLRGMAVATAIGFVLIGFALLNTPREGRSRGYQLCAISALFVGWLGFSRYLYGGEPLMPYGGEMAIHSSLLFMALGAAALALRPNVGLVALLAGGRIGIGSLRRLFPAVILLPLLAGALMVESVRLGWLGFEGAVSLFALLVVTLFAIAIWRHASILSRSNEQRERVERALRASEEHTRLILENALDAVITIDMTGTITGWSAQAEAIFGWPRAEMIGQVLADTIIPSRYRDAHREGLRRYLQTSVERVLNRRIELTALHRDGREFPIEIAITPIRSADTLSFSAFVRDITQQRQLLDAMRAHLQRLDLLDRTTRAIADRQDLASIFQVVLHSLEEHFAIDLGAVLLFEAPARALTVYALGPKSGALADRVGLGMRARITADASLLEQCLHGQLVYEPDVAAPTRTLPRNAGEGRKGAFAPLASAGLRSVIVSPLIVDGSLFGVLIAVRAATKAFSSGDCEFLRQLSQHVALAAHQAQLYGALETAYQDLRATQHSTLQQERLRALGQMASGIAHDINNALSPALLYTQSLREQDSTLSQPARNALTVVQRAMEDVAHTVRRMREFCRPDTEQSDQQPVDLNRMVEDVLALTRARWHDMPQEHGAVIESLPQLDQELPAVLGTESEIRDALTNLVFNAVDAMPEGGTLMIRTGTLRLNASNQCAARLEVMDTGVGMDAEVRRRCLEPFYTTKGERGTGLGLAMVYGMVKRHRADIEIESEPGKGTTVRLTFSALAPAPAQRAAPVSQPARANKLRILLIDDDPLITESLRVTLQVEGHRTDAADGGAAGIAAFLGALAHGDPYDIVITDLGMPYVDGRQVASAVKAAASATFVLLLTGWGHRLESDAADLESIDRILSKPPRLADLRAALAEVSTSGHVQ